MSEFLKQAFTLKDKNLALFIDASIAVNVCAGDSTNYNMHIGEERIGGFRIVNIAGEQTFEIIPYLEPEEAELEPIKLRYTNLKELKDLIYDFGIVDIIPDKFGDYFYQILDARISSAKNKMHVGHPLDTQNWERNIKRYEAARSDLRHYFMLHESFIKNSTKHSCGTIHPICHKPKYFSERGIPLITQQLEEDVDGNLLPTLTVENHNKWYAMYIIHPDDTVEKRWQVEADDKNENDIGWYDHAVIPRLFHETAVNLKCTYDDRTFALVCERFVEDGFADWTTLYKYLPNDGKPGFNR